MKVRCYLADVRGDRSISEMARKADVPRPYLSQIEAGLRLPTDEEAVKIAQAYESPLEEWYDWIPPQLLAVELDA